MRLTNQMNTYYQKNLYQQTVSQQNHSFKSTVISQIKSYTKISVSAASDVKTVDEMSMAEYKQYIHEKISRIPVHPSRVLESRAINISEKGFEAMKNDPEYESWVLDTIKKDNAINNPWTAMCGGGYVVHNFGATKEEYSGQGWYPGYMNGKGKDLFDAKTENSFWVKRAKTNDEYMEKFQEMSLEKLFSQRGRNHPGMPFRSNTAAIKAYVSNFLTDNTI